MKNVLFSTVALYALLGLGASSTASADEGFIDALKNQGALKICGKAFTGKDQACSTRLVAAFAELVCIKDNIDHYGKSLCHENAIQVLGDDAPVKALKSEVENLSAQPKQVLCKSLKKALGKSFVVSKVCAAPLVIVSE